MYLIGFTPLQEYGNFSTDIKVLVLNESGTTLFSNESGTKQIINDGSYVIEMPIR
jgi:hypothetical protein